MAEHGELNIFLVIICNFGLSKLLVGKHVKYGSLSKHLFQRKEQLMFEDKVLQQRILW